MGHVRRSPRLVTTRYAEYIQETLEDSLPDGIDERFRARMVEHWRRHPPIGGPRVWNLHGIPHYDADLPRRWHRCWVQTYGLIGFETVERCACGAMRRGGRRLWAERNSRRKHH